MQQMGHTTSSKEKLLNKLLFKPSRAILSCPVCEQNYAEILRGEEWKYISQEIAPQIR